MSRAPLRWAGSKRKSIPVLARLVPQRYNGYVEPFAGSACLAFHLRPERLVLGDLNPQLVEFYQYLRDNPAALHHAYRALPANPTTYYEVRTEYNNAAPSVDRAAKFLYLNRYCFNGIYRVNSRGSFNVPWGGDKVGLPLTLRDLMDASDVLQSAVIECSDFESFTKRNVRPGDFVYIDPPYARDETRVFREYHERSFASADWSRMLSVLAEIDSIGAYFLMSYAGDQALIKELDSWNVGYLDVTRNVGGFKSSRRKHREFMATNVEPTA